jgi:Mce-associated membrane protein
LTSDAASRRSSDEPVDFPSAAAICDEMVIAEAEAAEAEATAAAARARARAIRLRQAAATAQTTAEAGKLAAAADDVATAVDSDSVAEEALAMIDTVESPLAPPGRGKRIRLWARRLRRPRWITVAAMASVILIATSAAAAGAVWWQHRETAQNQQRSAEFAAAARQGVVNLMSLDYSTAKDDVGRLINNTTDDFRKDLESTRDDFIKVVQDSKVSTTCTVNATAVQSMSVDSAIVLVAATSDVTNTAGAKHDPRTWRLGVTITRDGDQLKMSKVEFVP